MSDAHDQPPDSLTADAPMAIGDLLRTHEELRRANADLQRLADDTNRAREVAEQRADELAALNRVAAALSNVTDLRTSLRMATRELTEVFKTRGSTVTLIDEARDGAEVVAEYFTDSSLPSVIGLKVPLDVPAWQRLDAERAAIVIERPGDDSILGSVREVMRARSVSQLLVAPLISRGLLIGNLSVSHEPGRSFSREEVMLAQTLAGPVAQAVENARLYESAQRAREVAEAATAALESRNSELAAKNELLEKLSNELERANHELERLSVTDALTGIPNRRLFHDVIEAEWRRAQRAGEPLAVLMVDVDFFKSYNDAYGHQLGDECLVRVAKALQSSVHRVSDFVARYGGEEFVAVLPGSEEAPARRLAERFCEEVRALAIPHERSFTAPVVTVSVGCAAIVPRAGGSSAALIAAADHALYEAKRSGRNRVACAEVREARF